MKSSINVSRMMDGVKKTFRNITNMFIEESNNIIIKYENLSDNEIIGNSKKESVLTALEHLKLSTQKRWQLFINNKAPSFYVKYGEQIFSVIEKLEDAYLNAEESDIDDPNKQEAVIGAMKYFQKIIDQLYNSVLKTFE